MPVNSVNDRTSQIRHWTHCRGTIALGILLVCTGAILGWAAAWRGSTGVRWALLALLVCGCAGLASLFACKLSRGPQAALLSVLIGMGIRMTAALAACLIVKSMWPDGIDAGFGWYLVIAYLAMLALDILYLADAQPPAGDYKPGVGPVGKPLVVPSIPGERHG
jgi:hypothetical protein